MELDKLEIGHTGAGVVRERDPIAFATEGFVVSENT
jgi:hypothetical protein